MKSRIWRVLALLLALALVAAACGSDDSDDSSSDDAAADDSAADDAAADDSSGDDAAADDSSDEEMSDDLMSVSLQLQWVTQAQFCGYFAAADQGYWEDLGLDVEIIEGGVDIVPGTVLASGGADFGVSWVPRALAPREEGADIVEIAQIFQRSGTLQVSFADAGITDVTDLEGMNVGSWGFGNESELYAGLRANDLDPDSDVTIVQQNFDMQALLDGSIDAAQAMTYNEYAQVLETVNPDTGELYQPEDLAVIDWNDVGTAMLQDSIWADAARLESDEDYRAAAVALVEGSIEGWVYCRDNPDEAVAIVLAAAPILGESHQTWQLNEINKLIWPSPDGVGLIDEAAFDQTVEIATAGEIITGADTEGAWTNDIVTEALANLEAKGVDVVGDSWTPVEVTLNEGGE